MVAPDGGERTIRVLHVDDDPAFLDIAATFIELRLPGVTVETSTDVESALRSVLDGRPFDCVISGHRPPEVDGLSLLDRLRERGPSVPFVLYAWDRPLEVIEALRGYEHTAYVSKGGLKQFDALIDQLRSMLEPLDADP
jgi:DNA-binding NtrC family response regulator